MKERARLARLCPTCVAGGGWKWDVGRFGAFCLGAARDGRLHVCLWPPHIRELQCGSYHREKQMEARLQAVTHVLSLRRISQRRTVTSHPYQRSGMLFAYPVGCLLLHVQCHVHAVRAMHRQPDRL